MQIIIEPVDTLFFRDGKPFSMGDETFANSIFPPNPSTIHGAIFATYASQKGLEPGSLGEYKSRLKIKFFSLVKEDNNGNLIPLYAVPYDLVKKKDNKSNQLIRLHLEENNFLSSIEDFKLSRLLFAPNCEEVEFESCFIDKIQIENYLGGKAERLSYHEGIFFMEPKIGIGLGNHTKTALEGRLYRVDMIRLKEGIKLFVEFEGLELKEEGFLRLGGEGKGAYYKRVNISCIPNLEKSKEQHYMFKLYLHTPAIFKNGSVKEAFLRGEYMGLRFKLVSMAVGKPKYIGGFDMERQRPKNMYKAVPEGSIYIFETEEPFYKVLDKFHGKNISDLYSEQGYGITFVGRVS